MPLYMDVHKNEQLNLDVIAIAHQRDLEVQQKYGVRYLRWWFNDDLHSLYCLVEAPSAEAATAVHREAHANVADEIIEVAGFAVEGFLGASDGKPVVREEPPDQPPSTDTAFRAILFTDMEGSTSLTQRLGDEAAMQPLRAHNAIIRDALQQHAGNEVKHTGDGVMASFAAVARAVECAIGVQRGFESHNAANPEMSMRVRIGATAGEPVAENRDLFGATVQLAARLCSHAEPGQILVSGVIRDLCIGKRFAFQERGESLFKGFDEPVRLFEVGWQG
ncbi:MAG: hypothetical protein A2148_05465 [Chloroflexi bacterium RBG_16_68_14]|nr:MAG: hypothetical protein A2148_05465 [Chloroflexi bacterium RBG_16_68_14]